MALEGLFNGIFLMGLPKAILATTRIADSGESIFRLRISPRIRIKIEKVTASL